MPYVLKISYLFASEGKNTSKIWARLKYLCDFSGIQRLFWDLWDFFKIYEIFLRFMRFFWKMFEISLSDFPLIHKIRSFSVASHI